MEDLSLPTTLPTDDRRLRRDTTDKYGYYAFYSAMVMMVFIVIVNKWLAPLFQRAINLPPAHLRKRAFSYSWVNVGMLGWSLLIMFFSFYETYGDLVWFVKRTGRLAVALMPPMYLLTLKPNPLPKTLYLQVLPMHKWLSRLVVIISTVHGVGYAINYHLQGAHSKLRDPANIAGYVALVIFLLMGLTAFGWYRRLAYRVFYSVHYIGAWVCLPLLSYHSRPSSDSYLYLCGGILFIQIAFRIWTSTRCTLRVQYVSPTLLLVDIGKEKLPGRFWSWTPGAHVRLSGVLYNPLTWVQSSHPYTISSLAEDPTLQLVIRKGNFPIKMRRQYSLNGPYSCIPSYFDQQIKDKMVRRALFIIGGSGIAFGAPLFRYLKLYGVRVKLLWAIRDPYDAKALKALRLHEDMVNGDIEVYYTGHRLEEDEDEDENLEIDISEDCDTAEHHLHPQRDRIHRKVSNDDVLSDYVQSMYNSRPHLNLRLRSWLYGLNLDDEECCCADRLIDACEEDKLGVWVISTGNPKLVQDAKQWAYTSGVNFFEEEFTL